MQALNRLRTRLFKQQAVETSGIPPLYQRKPPLWAQWTWALVGCDIFMTFVGFPSFLQVSDLPLCVCSATAVELTWSHWTEPAVGSAQKPTKNEPSDTSPTPFVLRPVWQRLGLSVFHLGVGVAAAVALIGSHTRVVRTICILPRQASLPAKSLDTDTRQIFIQCAHHWRNRGRLFPMSSCRLDPGRDDSEFILRVDGERGHWWIGLNKATMNGRDMSLAASRATLLREWRQEKNTAWKRGPILLNKMT
jgi:hypothetical protein